VSPNFWIEIYSAGRRLVLLVVSTKKNRSSTAVDYTSLKVGYRCATDPASLVLGMNEP